MKISNLHVETVRKDIKNIHLGIYPPDGKNTSFCSTFKLVMIL